MRSAVRAGAKKDEAHATCDCVVHACSDGQWGFRALIVYSLLQRGHLRCALVDTPDNMQRGLVVWGCAKTTSRHYI